MNNDEKSLDAISKFKDLIEYKGNNGGLVELLVEVYRNGTHVHEEKTGCGIAENYQFGNLEIIINWSISNEEMTKLSLHPKYNTKFQDFEFDGKKLSIICNDGTKISLWKSK